MTTPVPVIVVLQPDIFIWQMLATQILETATSKSLPVELVNIQDYDPEDQLSEEVSSEDKLQSNEKWKLDVFIHIILLIL